MPPNAATTPHAPARRKVGRPSRLSQELIVHAAYEVGLENVTMKTVADHLGVSVPGLYHYVRGKDDLLRLAAEFSAGRIELPSEHGQHWAVWLYEWAMYNRAAFMAEPGLLKQFIDGAIAAERTSEGMNSALGTLVQQGFPIADARVVYGLVSEFAIGAAVAAIRERQATADGRPSMAEYHRVLAQRGADDLPHLRLMLADVTANPPRHEFHKGLMVLLRGVATHRGEKWPPIEAKITRFIESR